MRRSLLLFMVLSTVMSFNTQATDFPSTIEELRLPQAQRELPAQANRYQKQLLEFNERLTGLSAAGHDNDADDQAWVDLVEESGSQLWLSAVNDLQQQQDNDDRPLYWARLQFSRDLRAFASSHDWSANRLQRLLKTLENTSRGRSQIAFDKQADYRILLTGFDPFFLDRHINQSNPSGVVALATDNWHFVIDGQQHVEVQSVMVPVRFADFDQGIIESLLTPIYQHRLADMVLTVSMGRTDFDLEHFPGRRRSAKAPDNLNVYTGATPEHPLLPQLNGAPLPGAEFVKFSLPYQAMLNVKGPYEVNDNHQVTTLEKGQFSPKTLAELRSQTAVSGSGGGYLSNEISYRAVRLRDAMHVMLPVGHIHTPRIAAFDDAANQRIVNQIKALISAAAATELNKSGAQ